MSKSRFALTLIIALFSVMLGFAGVSSKKEPAPLNDLIPTQSKSFFPNTSLRSATHGQPTVAPKLEGCVTCHGQIEPMHKYGTTETLDKLNNGKDAVGLTCTACHGGNPVPRKTSDDPQAIQQIKEQAHVRAKFPAEWQRDGKFTGANPERTNTLLARESWEFIRFINPGDLRVVPKTCGGSACHDIESRNVARSMMTHGAMLWAPRSITTAAFL